MRIKSKERVREISEEKKTRELNKKNRGKSSESILKSANEMISIVNQKKSSSDDLSDPK